jgi:hypothetical protein
MLKAYIDKNFRQDTMIQINQAIEIIDDYAGQGYDLTLRQLYYQFVARGLIPNTDKEYQKLSRVISDARLAGLISWTSIVDRLRLKQSNSHWNDPGEIIEACASQYRIDSRQDQDTYIEVWVEKDALSGVLDKVCTNLDIPYLVCRGYVSQSAMWQASQRFINKEYQDKKVLLLHLGDHDPSGLDMTRDIQSRLELFGSDTEVKRIGLNMDQVRLYNPPPNPAKLTDVRARDYILEYGSESWELDALEPQVIEELIEEEVKANTDMKKLKAQIKIQKSHRELLQRLSDTWEDYIE